ncbi:uncharacterized protein CIMG_04335 [Coccidioides immitis RS]|uniref:Wax synthase domain-containing protein n=1 Tax=Coccidioides immitis (strain RS) TaxID=246410 RepID=J3KD98_COCIM|nr:uncharacterized protein CIMG_04335 [Coccidioides immitis RS]EAS33311.3 hypothetical protein CIMG_04335 [Coccidioides immitis RS]
MALGLIDVPSWLALVEIFIMQATTVAVLAYAPKSAIKIRISVTILTVFLAAHIHWIFPYNNSALNHMVLPSVWGQVLHLINALLVTNIEYVNEMKWKMKAGKVNAISNRGWDRIVWAWNTIWNGRWIGTRWEEECIRRDVKEGINGVETVNGSHKKGKGQSIGRVGFAMRRFQISVAAYLVLDLLGWVALPQEIINSTFTVEKQYVFRRMTEISLEELAIRTGSVIGFAAAAMAMIVQLHAFASAVIVGLGIHDPEEWPLMYGRISDAWSVRRFWGLVWHQQLRRPLVSYSELLTYKVLRIPKRNGILARYVRVGFVFALSGILHVVTDHTMGIPVRESGAMDFFLTQALGIALEDILFTTHRFNDERLRRGPKVFRSKALGYLWTMAFFGWTAPVWTYPAMRHSSPQKIKPVPFSVFKYLFG